MKAKVLTYLSTLILYLLLSYSVFFLLDIQTILMLTREDGLFEIIGAMFFLSASILFLVLLVAVVFGILGWFYIMGFLRI